MPNENELKAMLKEAKEAGLPGLCRELCERLLEVTPDDFSLLCDYANHLITFGHYDEAVQALDRAESVCPPKALKWVLGIRGHLFQERGDFKQAEAWYLRAHELDPEQASFLIYAAAIVFRSGAVDRAIDLARRATQCSKGCVDEALFNLGGYLLSKRRYEEARECYRQALKIDPEYASAKKQMQDVKRILSLPPREPLPPTSTS